MINMWRHALDMVGGFIFAMFLIVALIGYYLDIRFPAKPPRKVIICQFCDHTFENGYYFRGDWVCFRCWEQYQLEEYVDVPRRFSSWLKADVKIEEIHCNGKL